MSTQTNQCLNCQKPLSCTCKLRTASDGTKCCTSCIQAYEQHIKNKYSSSK